MWSCRFGLETNTLGVCPLSPRLFVCLFVCWNKTSKTTPPPFGREVNPLGVITHGQRHKSRAYQRQRHKPRTCQSVVNTLQVDRLTRIPGLTPALYNAHRQAPNGVPAPHTLNDVSVLDGGRGKTMNSLVDRDRELPANTANLNKT